MQTVDPEADRGSVDPPRILVLMAVYNGATFLGDQLDSLERQTCQAWDLLVSDDGSSDGSRDILAVRARHWSREGSAHRLSLIDGPQRGLVGNFFHLLSSVPPGTRLAALSDQDDVWFPDKLERAQAQLATVPDDRPALYCARTMICAADLTPLHPSRRFRRAPDFRNALVQSIGGGNTMVLNRAAVDLARAASAEAGDAAVHDWWLYQIVSGCGGVILRDGSPVLLYRQHGANAIGANTSLGARFSRVRFILGRRFARWNDVNLRALHASRHRLTPDAAATLDAYAAARQGAVASRLRALRASGVHRQGRLGTVALYLACLFGRL